MKYSTFKVDNIQYSYVMVEDKLAYFGLESQMVESIKKDFPKETLIYEAHLNPSFEKEIHAYFKGELKVFKTPIYYSGTPFQKEVYHYLAQIPYGKTISYRELASLCGDVKKARAIGNAVGMNRHLILVPCHRVLSHSGKLGGFSSGLDLKRALLKLEKINYL